MENNPDNKRQMSAQDFLAGLSAHDFKALGVGAVAYVRRRSTGEEATFTLHAADGEELAAQQSEAAAWQSARRQDLNLVTVH